MDRTLSMIIVELLKKLRQSSNGYPSEFAPPDVRSDGVNYGGNGGGQEKWLQILDEMIEGFSIMASEGWPSVDITLTSKAQHALHLFANFYMNLWD
ncbi:MAG: hypothetical protein HC836_37070 [Richelia sp. RM2_1_2]|nr:hypothetical protein [Richelia sp. RM2_1_2]